MTTSPETPSRPTRGRTLDHAARVYDWREPVLMLGRQEPYDRSTVEALNIEPAHRVLDLGCGTGVLTRLVADRLDATKGGFCLGINAASTMIAEAHRKRAVSTCLFRVMAAEDLHLEDNSFDAVISTLFFHHGPGWTCGGWTLVRAVHARPLGPWNKT